MQWVGRGVLKIGATHDGIEDLILGDNDYSVVDQPVVGTVLDHAIYKTDDSICGSGNGAVIDSMEGVVVQVIGGCVIASADRGVRGSDCPTRFLSVGQRCS